MIGSYTVKQENIEDVEDFKEKLNTDFLPVGLVVETVDSYNCTVKTVPPRNPGTPEHERDGVEVRDTVLTKWLDEGLIVKKENE